MPAWPTAILLAITLAGLSPTLSHAQESGSCSYATCALAIAPVCNGLDVVRGSESARVARLGFFWASNLRPTFVASDSASFYAIRAMHVRRNAAVLTDAGAVLLGYTIIRRFTREPTRSDRIIGVLGAGSFAVGIPLQFSADGLLSRAVWWHNARYAQASSARGQ